MKRTDIVMSEELKSFLSFDIGQMRKEFAEQAVQDIVYHDDLKLDLYLPLERSGKTPVVIIVFGGGWVSGFKQDGFVEPMARIKEYGYAAVVPDYTLALDDCFPRPVQDIQDCVKWVRENADTYRFDTDRITLWGESAGAHLALEAGLMSREDSRVSGIIAMYPLTDLDTVDAQAKQCGMTNEYDRPGSVVGVFMGKGLNDKEIRRQASPVNQMYAGMPDILVQHGTSDKMIPYLQSQEFYDTAEKQGYQDKVQLEIIPGKEHTDPWFFQKENLCHLDSWMKKTKVSG